MILNINKMKNPKKIELLYGIKLEFNEKQYEIIKKGLIPNNKEDKWYVYFENNWLYFIKFCSGQEIYKAELIYKNNYYYIDDIWVERDQDIYSNLNDDFDICIIHIIVEWGMLGIDCRNTFLPRHTRTDKEHANVLDVLGNLFKDKEKYDDRGKIILKDLLIDFDKKMLGYIYNLNCIQKNKNIETEVRMQIYNESKEIGKITFLNIKSLKYYLENKDRIGIAIHSDNLLTIYGRIDWIMHGIMKYMKGGYVDLEKIFSNLLSDKHDLKYSKDDLNNFLSYKDLLDDNICDGIEI